MTGVNASKVVSVLTSNVQNGLNPDAEIGIESILINTKPWLVGIELQLRFHLFTISLICDFAYLRFR